MKNNKNKVNIIKKNCTKIVEKVIIQIQKIIQNLKENIEIMIKIQDQD